MKKILDSGSTLDITVAPFGVGRNLLKVVMKELESIRISKDDEIVNVIKDLVSRIISSEAIEEALWPCMARATYNNFKITPELFEKEDVRADYLIVAYEILLANLSPFLRNVVSKLPEGVQKNIKPLM